MSTVVVSPEFQVVIPRDIREKKWCYARTENAGNQFR